MRIVFIQPDTKALEAPRSLAYLCGVLLRSGHEASIIDLQIPAERIRWEEILLEKKPNLIGITAMTCQIKQVSNIAKTIKELFPKTPVVIGGVHATVKPKETLLLFPSFDIAVIGEGEETILELVEAIEKCNKLKQIKGIAFRDNNKIIFTPRRERLKSLDKLPLPHDFYNFNYYLDHGMWGYKIVNTIASRGCIFNCRFCAHTILGKGYINRSTDNVINEIKYLLNRGAKGIFFRDSIFVINRAWVMELCDKIISQNIKFRWGINARVDLVDFELLVKMRKAGLRSILFGVESGSQRILDYYKRNITIPRIENAFILTKRAGIRAHAFFMIGAPIETRSDIEKSRQLARRIDADQTTWNIFTPFPGSEIYDEISNLGYKLDYNNIRYNKANYPLEDLTCDELEALRINLISEFNRLRLKTLTRRGIQQLRFLRSWDDLKEFMYKVRTNIGIIVKQS